jgi:MFS family permease
MLRWIDTVFPRRALFQRDRRLLYLFLGRVLGSTGFSIVIPFLGLYLHGQRGVPMSAVGAVFFVAALAGAMGQIVGGEWTDNKGRKYVLVLSQIVRSFAFLGMGLAVMVDAPFLWFAVLTSLSAFAGRMFEPPSGAMIADIAEGERRVEYFGILRIGGNLGWALGPAIGGFLAALSYSSLFLVSAGLLFMAGLLMAFKVVETSPRHRAGGEGAARRDVAGGYGDPRLPVPAVGPTSFLARFGMREILQTFRDRSFLRYCLVTLLFFTVMAQLMSTLSVYAVEWAGLTKVQLGTIYSMNGLMVVFLQFPAVRFTNSMRLTTAMALGSALYGIGYGMMGLGSGMGLLTFAMFVVTAGEIVATPPSQQLASNFSTEATRGRYMGIYGLFNSFGWSLGPLVGGVLLDTLPGRPMMVWGAITLLAFLAVLGYLDLRRRLDPSRDRNTEGAVVRTAAA